MCFRVGLLPVVSLLIAVSGALHAESPPSPSTAIGSRRELFVDDTLIEKMTGGVQRCLQHPVAQEAALVLDQPWEGNGSGGYASIFQDGDRYRLYYTTYQIDPVQDAHPGQSPPPHPLFTCYAESTDGIHWTKPELGLCEFAGSKRNNIVFDARPAPPYRANAGHVAIFKDENPAAPAAARYKALIRADSLARRPLPGGLLAYQSSDGLHWSLMTSAPVITAGAFDSQNLAFWDPVHGEYRAYWRYDTGGTTNENVWEPSGVRAVRTATSPDFLHWSQPVNLSYTDQLEEHLYTNQVKPYYRAPQILIGLPTRYIDRGWSDPMRALPDAAARRDRGAANARFGTALTEGLLMSSRDGVTFQRWEEAFLRPGPERPNTWAYGDHYLSWQVIETASALPGAPRELSLFASEGHWIGTSSVLRRYTLRIDGFVSVAGSAAGGELVTKPLTFAGDKLTLNFSTSAAGSVRIAIEDAQGQPIPGFALADCSPLFGDTLDRTVAWTGGRRDLHSLAGRPVRLRFELKDADLYSFQFVP